MRVVFIGTGEIGVPVLRWLVESSAHELVGVVTQPDKPVGRDQRLQAPPIKSALVETRIPLLQPERIKREEAIAQIRALAPEVIVVLAYGQILPRAVLEIPSIACLNLHASLLPKYRGAAPIQAAIVNGDSETGLTVMYMDEGLDTGDTLLTSPLAIAPNETGGSLHDRLAALAPNALAEALQLLAVGNAPRTAQNSAAASYAPKLLREHGRIDWSESATIIERKIRAFDPWPGSFTILRDEIGAERNLKIFAATIADETGAPGTITVHANGEIIIAAGAGGLRLDRIQLEGKKQMNAAEFSRGRAWLGTARAVSFSFPS
ncbi:MAG: methionyl-tRNA formyltransferase [Verrucomicrobiota bacterium]|nr:methionyl-tRNA formyltransferase [Verrucomicrobiota bacterium]